MQKGFALWVANVSALVALLAGNLVLVNLIGGEWHERVDLTARNAYTVSPATRDTLEEVEDEVVVEYLLSRETLPRTQEFQSLEREILDRFAEFDRYCKGDIVVQVNDPVEDDQIDARVRDDQAARGIQPAVFQVKLDEGTTRDYTFYSTLRIAYRGREEIVNQVTDARDVEYLFVTTLRRLRQTAPPKVGLASIAGEREAGSWARFEPKILDVLGEHAVVSRVDIEKGPEDLEGLDALYVLVRDTVNEKQLYELDQFIMKGGRAVICTENFSLARSAGDSRMGGYRWELLKSGIEPFLEHFGVKPQFNMVFDLQNVQKMPQSRRGGRWIYLYYSFNVATDRNSFNPKFPFTRNLEGVSFWFAHGLEPAEGIAEKGYEFEPLVRSSELSWAPRYADENYVDEYWIANENMVSDEAEAAMARWQQEKREELEVEGAVRTPIAAVVRGEFKSYFADREPPAGVSTKNYKLPEDASFKERDGRKTILASPVNRVVVVGDCDWVQHVVMLKANRDFLVELAGWLAEKEDLTELVGKSAPAKPLYDESDTEEKEEFEGKKIGYMVVMSVLSPLLVLAVGVAKLVLRQQEKVVQEKEASR
ncbi:MAG: GldG family protein [Planctomycetes bacterium]|nr:GldG family protein [Planctomycetota bacterium]